MLRELDSPIRIRTVSARDRVAAGAEPATVLESLIATPDGEEPFTPAELFGNVLTMLPAGEDTTASAIAWTLHHLAAGPTAQQRLRAEAVVAFGDGLPAGAADIRGLALAGAAVREARRAPEPSLNRFCKWPSSGPGETGRDMNSRPIVAAVPTPVRGSGHDRPGFSATIHRGVSAVPVTTRPYTQEMVLIHRVFRREAAQLLRLVSATASGDVARARRLGQWTREYIGGLHHHHATEDALIWPLLQERVVLHRELVDRMETQHHALDATLNEITARLAAWEESAGETERDLLADSVADHRRVLLEHLHDEEELVMPLVEEYLEPDEWERVGKAGLENLPKDKVFLALGAILEEATDEERAFFLAKVPTAGRVLWKLVGQRQYRRRMAALRGGLQ